MEYINKIILKDCLSGLKELPDNSIDCCITSPPYWGLRSYETNHVVWDGIVDCEHEFSKNNIRKLRTKSGVNSVMLSHQENACLKEINEGCFCVKCGAWKGELGSEPDFTLFINHLIEIYSEVKRVLKPTGTCFVNLGDTYGGSGSGTTPNADTSKYIENSKQVYILPNGTTKSSKFRGTALNKSLLMIPEKFAIEMISNGFILRNEIIWHKPNQMPSSATDRFTVDFEKIFFFVKQQKYYFEQQLEKSNGGMKNMRTVWSINTESFPEAHFATYPEMLVARMIKAGCPEGGIILDQFMGAGTTAMVARKLNRNYVGFELNPDYIKITNKRLYEELGMWL